MLDLFEKQLARQKEQRAAMAAAKQAAEAKAKETSSGQNNSFESNDDKSPLRPGRNSKVKAMDQVKQWINDNNETAAGSNKRKLEAEIDFEQEIDNEDGEPAIKLIKSESPGSQTVNRLAQSGAVRIVSVNKQGNTGIAHKINGSKSPEKTSSEVVITSTKEKRPTGIVKKPGVTINPVREPNSIFFPVTMTDQTNNSHFEGTKR